MNKVLVENGGSQNILRLPQVSFRFNVPLNAPGIGIVAGGRAPSPQWLSDFAQTFPIWTADSGLNICCQTGIVPVVALGDFDSVYSESLIWAEKNNVIFEKYPVDKNLTDLQLTLKRIESDKPGATVILTGCWGGRFDHAHSNVFSCLGYSKKGTGICCLADENEVLLILEGGKSIEMAFRKEPDVLSLISLSEICTGINLNGTYWELENSCLKIDEPWAISNRIKSRKHNHINLGFGQGWLGLYLEWN